MTSTPPDTKKGPTGPQQSPGPRAAAAEHDAPPAVSSTAPRSAASPNGAAAVGHFSSDHHQSTIASLRRLYPFARPALPSLAASTVAAIAATICGLAIPLVIRSIVDGPIARHRLAELWTPALLLVGLGAAEAVLFWARRMLSTRPTMRVEATMRAALYRRLQQLPVAFHDRWPAGQLMSRAVSDLNTIRRFLAFGLVFLVVNVATFVVGVGILLTLSWHLGLVVAALAVPLVLLSFQYESRYQILARRSQDQVGDLATIVEESVLGVRILKACGRSAHLGRKFAQQAGELRATELSKARVIAVLWAVIIALPEIALGIALVLGIREVAAGTLSAGTLVAFFGTAMGLRWPIDSIGWLLAISNDTAAASERYFEVMDSPLIVTSPDNPVQAPERTGHLALDAVRFHFADGESDPALRRSGPAGHPAEILRGIDLELLPGETVAVVGATGSGKTTLTALMNRLYDVTGGSIRLDGVDIRDLDLASVTTAPAVPLDPQADDAWRGVATEDHADITTAVGIKLQARSRRLLGSLLRPHRRLGLLTIAVVIINELAFLSGPLIIAYGIDSAVPSLARGNGAPLTFTAIAYLAAGIVNAIAKAAFIRLSARISQAVMLDLRSRVFAHAQALSLSFHEKYTSGRVISRMTSDLDALSDLAEQGLDGLVSGVLSVCAISVALLFLDLPLGLIALVAFVPTLLLTRWFQGTSRKIYRRTRTAIASLIVQFTETMNGLRAVLTFRRESRNEAIFAKFNAENADANGDGLIALAKYTPGVRLIGNLTLAAVMIVGAVQVIDARMEIGILAAFLLYVRRLYDPLDELAMFYNSYQSASAALEKLSGLLQEVPAVPEPINPTPLPEIIGRITFERVRFSYSPQVEVLPTFDLELPAGQTLAVVGATGAGKSTLAKLLARFYDPTQGRVLLDGVDIATISTQDLRGGVIMVTQESFLFSGSVADNIALGKPSASRAEVEAAADAIGAGDFVRALPDGFDTDVRKRGGRLSAGQRQLVGFARAFLADPAVLILDEATASLDIPSERAVQAALRTVLRNRTAVIIAHRLSTVAIADRVLVMDHGSILEDGSPADLITGGGRFAGLHTAWQDSLA